MFCCFLKNTDGVLFFMSVVVIHTDTGTSPGWTPIPGFFDVPMKGTYTMLRSTSSHSLATHQRTVCHGSRL